MFRPRLAVLAAAITLAFGHTSAQADDQDDKQLSRKKAIDGFEHDATSLLL